MLLGDAPHLDGQVRYFYVPNYSWLIILKAKHVWHNICISITTYYQYAIFGKVTKGDETLKKLEQLPTRREGIFVMVRFPFLSATVVRCGNIILLFAFRTSE